MLLKLMKYDLKAILKQMVFYYIGLVALGIVSKVLICLFQNTRFATISVIPTALFFVALYACLFVTMIISMIRYYKNMLSDEGYLTHTLPVKRNTILFSKLISTIIVEIISVLVIAICAFLHSPTAVKLFIGELLTALNIIDYNIHAIFLSLLVIFEIILVGVSQLTLVALCLSVGASFNKNKIVMSFVFYVAIHVIVQIVAGIILSFTFILIMQYSTLGVSTIYLIVIIYIIVTIIYIALTYFINLIILNNKLNLQ